MFTPACVPVPFIPIIEVVSDAEGGSFAEADGDSELRMVDEGV